MQKVETKKNVVVNSNFTPPHDMENERAVLGSILIRSDAIHDIIDVVKPESFYSPQNQMIF